MGEVPLPPPLAPAAVRGIVFDLDGTLVDSYAAIADSLNAARAAFDLPALPPPVVRRAVGRGLETLIAELVGEDRVEAGVRTFRERYAEVFAARTFALPGVAETLASLSRRGVAMAVASNKPARFSAPILAGLGLLRHFRSVEGPDTAGVTKPDPRMLHRCASRIGLDPGRLLYVGDMVLDVESAARAGMPVVLVAGGSSGTEELRATGQRVLSAFAEIETLLEA